MNLVPGFAICYPKHKNSNKDQQKSIVTQSIYTLIYYTNSTKKPQPSHMRAYCLNHYLLRSSPLHAVFFHIIADELCSGKPVAISRMHIKKEYCYELHYNKNQARDKNTFCSVEQAYTYLSMV